MKKRIKIFLSTEQIGTCEELETGIDETGIIKKIASKETIINTGAYIKIIEAYKLKKCRIFTTRDNELVFVILNTGIETIPNVKITGSITV